MNTNKKLTSWGDFVFTCSVPSIVMVNGGLMAKTKVELFNSLLTILFLMPLAAFVLVTLGQGRTTGLRQKADLRARDRVQLSARARPKS
jgi:flagellar biogenesis protein FliO